MKSALTTCLILLFAAIANSQSPSLWKHLQTSEIFLPETAETVSMPEEYLTLSLDLPALRETLRHAPAEGSAEAKAGALQIEVPMPDGTMETFKVSESSVMHPDLAARYPMIKTFAGMGVTNRTHSVRFGYGPDGFHAIVASENGGSLVMPYATNQSQYYLCFPFSNFIWNDLNMPPTLIKKVPMPGETLDNNQPQDTEITWRGGDEGALATRYIYQLALAATGEYSANHGGTIALVLSSLVTAANTLNSVLERDLDIRLILIPNNDAIIFLDGNSDPYENANLGGALLGQNEDILNNIIGLSKFDVGHVFTGCCSDVGGVVSGSVCSQGKARGVTCHCSSNVVGTTLSIAAHEMGHQFSAGHTFSHCPGSEGQYHSGSDFEPGSGSTILSYQGACGSSNIPGAANVYYHGGTIGEFWTYTRDGGGNDCPTIDITSNHSPVVELPYTDGFYIPTNTPFELFATASDEDGDAITYAWEQINNSISAPLGQPFGDAPIFRVYNPGASGLRSFPRLSILLNNGSENTEVLPSYSRNLNFRCTVRDNNVFEGAGGVTWQDVAFKATSTADKFRVNYPNESAVVWKGGEAVEVTWDVANTTNNLVKCQAVNIWLSVDGGNTYPYLLAGATPNDGGEIVQVPGITSTQARVKVKAANNIFFDISNQNFQIQPAESPTFTISLNPQSQQICVPDQAKVVINTGSVLNFDTAVVLEIVDGLPAGVGVSFSSNPVQPGESSTLTLDMSNVTADGDFEVTLRSVAGSDTTFRTLFFTVIYSDFSALALNTPVSGASQLGLLPDFEWTALPNADLYDFQLSTSPNFEPGTIVDSVNNVPVNFYTPDVALTESKIYFWRVRPANKCEKGDWSDAATFQTYTIDCAAQVSNDVPKNISNIGTPTIESSLPVLQNSTITDLNIGQIKGAHDALADLEVVLKSPAGTEVVLFSQVCGNVAQFNFGMDDESPFEIDCPPLNGLNYKPQNPLSAFIGENAAGNWTLLVKVVDPLGQGGTLQNWNLEFCASITPNNPFLVKNEPLLVPPSGERGVLNLHLLVEDTDNGAHELRFTIVAAPKYGFLSRYGSQLGVGSHFTMSDIHNAGIAYTNTDPNVTDDYFTFIVEDGDGGWLGTPKFNIHLDPDAPLNAEEADFANQMLIFPNPTADLLNVVFQNSLTAEAELFVTDVHGRTILRQALARETSAAQVATGDFSDGLYFLNVRTSEGVFAKRFVVQR